MKENIVTVQMTPGINKAPEIVIKMKNRQEDEFALNLDQKKSRLGAVHETDSVPVFERLDEQHMPKSQSVNTFK